LQIIPIDPDEEFYLSDVYWFTCCSSRNRGRAAKKLFDAENFFPKNVQLKKK
jgi:hypothetical protein